MFYHIYNINTGWVRNCDLKSRIVNNSHWRNFQKRTITFQVTNVPKIMKNLTIFSFNDPVNVTNKREIITKLHGILTIDTIRANVVLNVSIIKWFFRRYLFLFEQEIKKKKRIYHTLIQIHLFYKYNWNIVDNVYFISY